MKFFWICFLIGLTCSKIVYVGPDLPDGVCTGTMSDPCSFRGALNEAVDYDELVLLPGVYVATVQCENEDFPFCFALDVNHLSVSGMEMEKTIVKDTALIFTGNQTMSNLTIMGTGSLVFMPLKENARLNVVIEDIEFNYTRNGNIPHSAVVFYEKSVVDNVILRNVNMNARFPPVDFPFFKIESILVKEQLLLDHVTIISDLESVYSPIISFENTNNIKILSSTFINTGLLFTENKHSIIDHCKFGYIGVVLTGCQDITISNSLFYNITTLQLTKIDTPAISLHIGGSSTTDMVKNILIDSNVFSNFLFEDMKLHFAAIDMSTNANHDKSKIQNITIINNRFDMMASVFAISNLFNTSITAEKNWFGTPTGPTDICNPRGTGYHIYYSQEIVNTLPIDYFPFCNTSDCSQYSEVEMNCPLHLIVLIYIAIMMSVIFGVTIFFIMIIYFVKSLQVRSLKKKALEELQRKLFIEPAEFDNAEMISDQITLLTKKNDIATIEYSDIIFGPQIGKGSYGVVYQATLSGDYVAVKQMNDECLNSIRAIQEYIGEITIMSKLQHPNVLALIGISIPDFYQRRPKIYLLSPLLKCSLKDMIYGKRKGKLTLSRKHSICLGVAEGMKYLHENDVIHRDLKPGNILLDEDYNPVIADMGIAKYQNQTITLTLRGTALYLAPESILLGKFGKKTDIYAYGITLTELFTGTVPFGNNKVSSLHKLMIKIAMDGKRPDLPNFPPIHPLLTQCTSEEPELRPTFDEIIETLDASTWQYAY